MAEHIRSNENREQNSFQETSANDNNNNTRESRQQQRLNTRLKNKTRRKLEKSSKVQHGDANNLMAIIQDCLVQREEIFPSECDKTITLDYEDYVNQLRELGYLQFEDKDKFKFVPKFTRCEVSLTQLAIFTDCLAPYKIYLPGIPIDCTVLNSL